MEQIHAASVEKAARAWLLYDQGMKKGKAAQAVGVAKWGTVKHVIRLYPGEVEKKKREMKNHGNA